MRTHKHKQVAGFSRRSRGQLHNLFSPLDFPSQPVANTMLEHKFFAKFMDSRQCWSLAWTVLKIARKPVEKILPWSLNFFFCEMLKVEKILSYTRCAYIPNRVQVLHFKVSAHILYVRFEGKTSFKFFSLFFFFNSKVY